MKIRPLGADLFVRTDEQTDRHDETNSRFSQFCETPRKWNGASGRRNGTGNRDRLSG